MQTMINGELTTVTPARMLGILTAEWRVEICRDLVRIKNRKDAEAVRLRAELEDELQALDEVAHQARLETVPA